MDDEGVKDALQEAKIMEVCNHPNIPQFFEVYRTKKNGNEQYLNIVMEYANGGNLN